MLKSIGARFCVVAVCAFASVSYAGTSSRSGGSTTSSQLGPVAPRPPELLACHDLPATNPLAHRLSGLFYDEQRFTLYAVDDKMPRLVLLNVSPDYKSITPGAALPLTGRPQGSPWDGEALTRKGNEFYAVTEETKALVERFDSAGKYVGDVPMPEIYGQHARDNKGLESLTISPQGTFLFAANEEALKIDRHTVRILRRNLGSASDEMRAYRADSVPPHTPNGHARRMGVSGMLALSDSRLLVLERAYEPGYGNTVRLYRVDFDEPGFADVLDAGSLGASSPALPKTLIVDFVKLPNLCARKVHLGAQPNAVLDNYEGLAIGPFLPDGRRILFVVSDDNVEPTDAGAPLPSTTQVPRVLVLALAL